MSSHAHTRMTASATEVIDFTDHGLQALDALAEVLVNRMARTPEGIARALEEVLHAPVEELGHALEAIADEIAHRHT